ncbi:MAG: nucleoside triphosphate pyrophosphohydrolase [Aphanocapsa feldmannii 288cV]|nr:MAG: nucleoside triphosphate pyrophosphohydrolase [Aphanocapsa feldmannii 288cV]
MARLIKLVARLRHPDMGCPWDLAQTHQSLIPHVLEEAHETADALRSGDAGAIREELGDLLLQVVLQAQIGAEQGRFNLTGICDAISDKLVRRHPHVFAGAPADGVEAVQLSWDAIKAEEDRHRGHSGESLSDQLHRKSRGQPSLQAAMTISRKAAAAGFEWSSMEGVWAKVDEEMAELREAVARGDRDHAEAELGDLLFTLVNVARWQRLAPEEALAGTNRRFLDRFARVEQALGGHLAGRGIEELEQLWHQAKAAIASEADQSH